MAPLPKSTARRHHAYLLALFSSLVISFALVTYFMLLPLSQFTTHHKAHKTLVPADLRALGKSSKVVEFAEHDAFRNLSHEHDHLWHDALLPPNGGFFTLSHQTNNTDKFGVAMFHQLHCLAMIRNEMQYMHDIITILKDPKREDIHPRRGHGGLDPLHQDHEHPLHCFDYLRQSLLCLADATIERPKLFDNGEPFIDGMGERRCRDWEILYKASTKSDEKPVKPDDLR